MRKSRFSDQQIALASQQVEHGASIAEACRKLEITEQTVYRWKKKFRGERARCPARDRLDRAGAIGETGAPLEIR